MLKISMIIIFVKNVLKMMNIDFCNDCGKMIHVDDAVLIDGDYYCYDCHETCNDCGCVMTRENSIYNSYSRAICQSCYECDYFSCESWRSKMY